MSVVVFAMCSLAVTMCVFDECCLVCKVASERDCRDTETWERSSEAVES